VVCGALSAERIAFEPCQMILGSLEKLGVRETLTASLAAEGLRLTQRGCDDVDTSARWRAVLEVLALAVLATATEGDFVDAGCVVLAGNEPDIAREDDVVAVDAVELAAALYPGLGFLSGLGYSGVGHEAIPSWSGLRGVAGHHRGHFFI
jgi:hypothetical protein